MAYMWLILLSFAVLYIGLYKCTRWFRWLSFNRRLRYFVQDCDNYFYIKCRPIIINYRNHFVFHHLPTVIFAIRKLFGKSSTKFLMMYLRYCKLNILAEKCFIEWEQLRRRNGTDIAADISQPLPSSILTKDDTENFSDNTNITLWLGSKTHVVNKQKELAELGVKFVINYGYYNLGTISYGNGIESLEITCIEENTGKRPTKMLPIIRQSVEVYKQCVQSGKSVLLHCVYGINRSATVAVAIVMAMKRIPVEQAFEYVRNRRHYIALQETNFYHLLKYEAELGITV
jgi:hypothetical protein